MSEKFSKVMRKILNSNGKLFLMSKMRNGLSFVFSAASPAVFFRTCHPCRGRTHRDIPLLEKKGCTKCRVVV
jgi:hypothetical protein